MKPRLSNEDYCVLAQLLTTSREIQGDMFEMITGKFPKRSKTIKKLLKLETAISDLYYQLEDEFFRDYPEKEV